VIVSLPYFETAFLIDTFYRRLIRLAEYFQITTPTIVVRKESQDHQYLHLVLFCQNLPTTNVPPSVQDSFEQEEPFSLGISDLILQKYNLALKDRVSIDPTLNHSAGIEIVLPLAANDPGKE
jgi:hypothetical protein